MIKKILLLNGQQVTKQAVDQLKSNFEQLNKRITESNANKDIAESFGSRTEIYKNIQINFSIDKEDFKPRKP